MKREQRTSLESCIYKRNACIYIYKLSGKRGIKSDDDIPKPGSRCEKRFDVTASAVLLLRRHPGIPSPLLWSYMYMFICVEDKTPRGKLCFAIYLPLLQFFRKYIYIFVIFVMKIKSLGLMMNRNRVFWILNFWIFPVELSEKWISLYWGWSEQRECILSWISRIAMRPSVVLTVTVSYQSSRQLILLLEIIFIIFFFFG